MTAMWKTPIILAASADDEILPGFLLRRGDLLRGRNGAGASPPHALSSTPGSSATFTQTWTCGAPR